jgi:hypothetical protein
MAGEPGMSWDCWGCPLCSGHKHMEAILRARFRTYTLVSVRQPFEHQSGSKPSGISGTWSSSDQLQIGQGVPAAPQPHSLGPSRGRSG